MSLEALIYGKNGSAKKDIPSSGRPVPMEKRVLNTPTEGMEAAADPVKEGPNS